MKEATIGGEEWSPAKLRLYRAALEYKWGSLADAWHKPQAWFEAREAVLEDDVEFYVFRMAFIERFGELLWLWIGFSGHWYETLPEPRRFMAFFIPMAIALIVPTVLHSVWLFSACMTLVICSTAHRLAYMAMSRFIRRRVKEIRNA